jgi:hypothetical protein
MRGAREDRTLVTSGPATPRFAHLKRNNDIIPATFLEEPPPVRRLLMIHYFIELQIKEPPRGFLFIYLFFRSDRHQKLQSQYRGGVFLVRPCDHAVMMAFIVKWYTAFAWRVSGVGTSFPRGQTDTLLQGDEE